MAEAIRPRLFVDWGFDRSHAKIFRVGLPRFVLCLSVGDLIPISLFASRHLLQIKLDISGAPLPRPYDPAALPLPKRCSYALI